MSQSILEQTERVTEQGHGRQPASMNQPTVCAVMLTADRPELARRAVECFRAQTYPAKRLLILDSGTDDFSESQDENGPVFWTTTISFCRSDKKTIGELRNEANAFWTEFPIIIHWDDDDYSHPNRITEQVALLQSSGADVVGYREMLFWREGRRLALNEIPGSALNDGCTDGFEPGEAWLYSNPDPRYCLGTSLCYWRKTWERKPFEATNQGEDIRFCTGLKCVGIPGLCAPDCPAVTPPRDPRWGPRMIARIHSGNTSTVYRPELMAAIERQGGEWRRSPEWDSYCRGVME